jgi:hypothetical protein
MIIQTDADDTIYKGNLLVSLGWRYLFFLFKKRKILKFFDRLIELPFFYFLSYIPNYIYTAFIPFRDCPLGLVNEIKKPLRKKWINKIKELKPEKIIIITHQEKKILKRFIFNNPDLRNYNFEIIANTAFIENGNFTGKSKIIITPYTKYGYINSKYIYLGDFLDYLLYGRKSKNFIFI